MVIYYLYKGVNHGNYSKYPFMVSESIKDARVKAMKYLTKIDKKGHAVIITKHPTEKPWASNGDAILMLATGYPKRDFVDAYDIKPSIGFKQGYQFTAVHNDGLYYLLKDGSLGEFYGYN